LRLTHAAITVTLIIALLAWVITLWQQGGATTGDVVLVCHARSSILNANAAILRWRWSMSPSTWRE